MSQRKSAAVVLGVTALLAPSLSACSSDDDTVDNQAVCVDQETPGAGGRRPVRPRRQPGQLRRRRAAPSSGTSSAPRSAGASPGSASGSRRHLHAAGRDLQARRRAGRRRQRAARRLRRRHPVRRLRRMKRVPSAARRDWRRTVESQGLVYPVTVLDDGTRGAVLVRGRGVRAGRVGGRAPRGRDRPAARDVRRGGAPPGHRRLRHARAVRAGAGGARTRSRPTRCPSTGASTCATTGRGRPSCTSTTRTPRPG